MFQECLISLSFSCTLLVSPELCLGKQSKGKNRVLASAGKFYEEHEKGVLLAETAGLSDPTSCLMPLGGGAGVTQARREGGNPLPSCPPSSTMR